jgi:ADP-ribose pyrophosphatase
MHIMGVTLVTLFTHQHKISERRVFEGSIINLRVDTLEAGGKKVTREVVEHNGGVVILCQPDPSQVVLIKQYRYSIGTYVIEFPAGRIEAEEDPLYSAKRELTEETGYIANTWMQLTRFYTAPGFCNEVLYVYLATDVQIGQKCPDEDEETEVIVASLHEAWQLVNKGMIQDSKTIAGLGLILFGRENNLTKSTSVEKGTK